MVLLLALVVLRHIVTGLTFGAVKQSRCAGRIRAPKGPARLGEPRRVAGRGVV